MNAKVIGEPRVVQDQKGDFLEFVFEINIEGGSAVEVTSRGPNSLAATETEHR